MVFREFVFLTIWIRRKIASSLQVTMDMPIVFFISTLDLWFILMLMADSPNIHVEISIRNDYQCLKCRNILFLSQRNSTKLGIRSSVLKKKIIKISLATLWIEKSNLTRLTLPLITITTFVTALSLALPFPKANHPRFLPLFSYFIFHFVRFIF